MYTDNRLYIANSEGKRLFLDPKMANRHGLITGATGTGKTVTMKVLAESFSDMGVPVFMADVKGDVSGLAEPGEATPSMAKRIDRFGIGEGWKYQSYPVCFWDIFGENGIPIRVTISDMGPILLARLLNLSDVQAGVLNITFRVADDNGLLLIDLKDLRSMLTYVSENRASLTSTYGNVSPQSIGAIQRALLSLEDQGGDVFFGEPALSISDWMRHDDKGRGVINLLDSTKLVQSPVLYSTFLLWLMTELFERLPELGDPEKPSMVFFFDEAHLLFSDAPKAFLDKIIQVVKLIRSKGVGIYFISQNPADIPNPVLAQLSNRIQHALRAYTPAEAKAVRVAASTFRPNPAFKAEDAIMELGTGEALVSFLDEKGIPSIVERAKILPPQSLMAPAQEQTRKKAIERDPLYQRYGKGEDRYSAYEKLTEEQSRKEKELEKAKQQEEKEAQRKQEQKNSASSRSGSSRTTTKKKTSAVSKIATKATNTVLNDIGRKLGKSITRSIFGNWN